MPFYLLSSEKIYEVNKSDTKAVRLIEDVKPSAYNEIFTDKKGENPYQATAIKSSKVENLTIDGKSDEWQNINPLGIEHSSQVSMGANEWNGIIDRNNYTGTAFGKDNLSGAVMFASMQDNIVFGIEVEDDDLVVCPEKNKRNPHGDHISISYVARDNQIEHVKFFLIDNGEALAINDDKQSMNLIAKWEKTNNGYFMEFQIEKDWFKISDHIARANISLYDTDRHLKTDNIYLKMEAGYAKSIKNNEFPYLVLE